MEIKTNYLGSNGVEYLVEYYDADSFDELPLIAMNHIFLLLFSPQLS